MLRDAPSLELLAISVVDALDTRGPLAVIRYLRQALEATPPFERLELMKLIEAETIRRQEILR